MQLLAPGLVVAALTLSAGCASSPFRAHRPDLPADGQSRVVIHQKGAPTHASIVEVDTVFNEDAFMHRQVDLPAGEHTLTIALSGDGAYANTELAFTAAPGRLYRLRTQQNGLGFRVRLWDETAGRSDRALLLETHVSGRGNGIAIDGGSIRAEANRPGYRMPTESTNPLVIPVNPAPTAGGFY